MAIQQLRTAIQPQLIRADVHAHDLQRLCRFAQPDHAQLGLNHVVVRVGVDGHVKVAADA